MRPKQYALAQRAMIEGLEQRRLLAGNITVTYEPGVGDASGTFHVLGDSRSNGLEIALLSGPDFTFHYTFQGTNGTTVNGQASVSVETADVLPQFFLQNFDIDLGNGDDTLLMNRSEGFGHRLTIGLDIQTGKGDDVVTLRDMLALDDVHIDTGSGDDTLRLHDMGVTLSRSMFVHMGSGDDRIDVIGVVIVNGSLDIAGDKGDDELTGDASLLVDGTRTIVVETIS